MTLAGHRGRGRGAARREGPARSARDLVLVTGLAGVVLGGVALMAKTARSTGSHLLVVLVVLALLLGVGTALARWGRAPARRRAGATGDGAGARFVDGTERTVLLPETDAYVTEVTEAVPVAAPPDTVPRAVVPAPAGPAGAFGPPAVDAGALDHLAVDPDGFEHTVAALCARDGCSPVEVVGGAGDLGADVIATAADGRRVVLQCKQYGEDHRVGSPDLQRFGGTCYDVHGADVAVLVTTSSFTEPALEYAALRGIVCVDGTELAAWTASTAPAPWDARAEEPVAQEATVGD